MNKTGSISSATALSGRPIDIGCEPRPIVRFHILRRAYVTVVSGPCRERHSSGERCENQQKWSESKLHLKTLLIIEVKSSLLNRSRTLCGFCCLHCFNDEHQSRKPRHAALLPRDASLPAKRSRTAGMSGRKHSHHSHMLGIAENSSPIRSSVLDSYGPPRSSAWERAGWMSHRTLAGNPPQDVRHHHPDFLGRQRSILRHHQSSAHYLSACSPLHAYLP